MALTTEEAASLALAVKQLLVTHGWAQEALQDEQGRLCLFGAVNTAIAGTWEFPFRQVRDMEAVSEFAAVFNEGQHLVFPEIVTESYGSCYPEISRAIEFNNMPGRTAEQIHQVLDAI